MEKTRYNQMMEGLITTAVEKVLVLGPEEANKEVEALRSTIEDLEQFWNGDQQITNQDWMEEFYRKVDKTIRRR